MSHLDKVYNSLPVWAQNIAVSTFGLYWHWLRFGPGYKHFLNNYLHREWYSCNQWKIWEQQKISELLKIAVENVPYYKRTWSKTEKKAAISGQLTDLPLLDKEPIRANPYEFLQENKKPFHTSEFSTSGTTGTPIKSIWTTQEIRETVALREARSALWAGVSFKLPRATFSGRMVEPDPDSKGPYYRFNIIERQAYLSAFHLKPDTAKKYLLALEKHGIQWLTGYAFSYYILAKYILEQGLSVPDIKAIVTTSEKVTDEMRKTMETAYKCRIYEEYSTVENSIFASECEQGRLHVSPDSSFVEILRPDGSPCDPDEIGEVVATCLFRTYQPLIRYRLGDLAVWDPDTCPCGREMPVIKEVIGRIEDAVTGPDGREIVRFHGLFVDQPYIREGQVIQESINRLRLKIVTIDGFSQVDIDNLTARVHQRLGHNIDVVVETVTSIPRTRSGKFQSVINLISDKGQG